MEKFKLSKLSLFKLNEIMHELSMSYPQTELQMADTIITTGCTGCSAYCANSCKASLKIF